MVYLACDKVWSGCAGCGRGAVEFWRARDGSGELVTSNTVFIAHLGATRCKTSLYAHFSCLPCWMLLP